MPPGDRPSLWSAVSTAENLSSRCLFGAGATITLADLVRGSSLSVPSHELSGRSVLIATADQFTTALALLELDGVARRLVLYPPDLPRDQVPSVISSAAVDAIVTDRITSDDGPTRPLVGISPNLAPANHRETTRRETEWILFTSGTTGMPKLVVHTLASLTGAIERNNTPVSPITWGTFYDIRRYGGLQIFLRAILTGGSLVLWGIQEATSDLLNRFAARGVTHISGTPSHWRRTLMSPSSHRISPRYIRLSGEIADQSILDHLRSTYPSAKIVHAFASTEAGVAFEVSDGLAGVPASLIAQSTGPVAMKIEDSSLRIRSNRLASAYLSNPAERLPDANGFVDTHDILELCDTRYYFAGRRDGIINVGGLKVHPEEVEAVINRHQDVRMSLVRTRKSPITGALVFADVVLNTAGEPSEELKHDILQHCRQRLARHKVPASIHFVDSLAVSPTGKLVRCHA